MTLPLSICEEILASAGFEGLSDATESSHKKRLRVIRDQMRELSSDFAEGISSESRYSMAYFLYNFPLNFMKTLYVFGEISIRRPDFLTPRQRYRILDIGCGEGAGMYGAYYALKSLDGSGNTRLNGIDGSRKMLERARDMAARLRRRGEDLTAGFANRDLTDIRNALPRKRYDIIICSNSLAEIIREETLPNKYIGILLGHLCENGILVIIEPALKKYARRLMQLRDDLVKHKAAQVILPCLHREKCSLLKIDSRDEWCHESVAWKPPAFLRILNKGLNREIDTLKFTYLVIARTKSQHVLPEGYRVISGLLKEKGRMRIFLCTERGRVELVRLNRSKSGKNLLFGRIHKGDLIKLHDIVVRNPDYWEVNFQTVVEIL
ncbi:MAG: methyltransferase domain-containing protein [candidate division WOR-3 bacterium]|nr:MAG: methyltransferase domain-containing protein [candidate division WOR-3 bacterium]